MSSYDKRVPIPLDDDPNPRYSRIGARELVLDLDTGEDMDTGERAGLFGTL